MSERTTNINIGGGNIGGLQIGDNNQQTITQTNGDQVPTVPQVFDAIKKSLPTIEPSGDDRGDDTVDYIKTDDTVASSSIDDSADDVNESILRPLQTLAELPPEEQKQPDRMEQAQSLINRLVPYAPTIGKGLAVFGSAALASLASSNPIISGILAVCKLGSAESTSS
jgi:hypothetical protein